MITHCNKSPAPPKPNIIVNSLNEIEDAEKFIALTEQYQTGHIIIDDYRLGKLWEQTVYSKNNNIPLLVIDDLLREHYCDFLVDMKWRGDQTQSAYDTLTPKHCIKLLGSSYVLLDEKYRSDKKPSNIAVISEFTIMFGLGGAGDLLQCVII